MGIYNKKTKKTHKRKKTRSTAKLRAAGPKGRLKV